MRHISCLLLTLIAIATSASSARAITKDQALVGSALSELKLELVPSDVIGGPQTYKVTKKTIKHLQELMNDGKVIILDNDGTIKIAGDNAKEKKVPRDGEKPTKRKLKADVDPAKPKLKADVDPATPKVDADAKEVKKKIGDGK